MGRSSVSYSVKWQIVGLKKAGELSNVGIGKLLHVSENCVRQTWKTYVATGGIKVEF